MGFLILNPLPYEIVIGLKAILIGLGFGYTTSYFLKHYTY